MATLTLISQSPFLHKKQNLKILSSPNVSPTKDFPCFKTQFRKLRSSNITRKIVVSAKTTTEKPWNRLSEDCRGFVDELRFVAIKLHTREQTAEGEKEAKAPEEQKIGKWEPKLDGYLKYLVNIKLVYDTLEEIIDNAAFPGYTIDAYGVGKVVVSGNPEFETGDTVAGLLEWGDFTVIKSGGMLNKLNPMGFPLSYHVGILGFSGLTAYAGFFEICKPRKGEKVFVSAALGSVGNLVSLLKDKLGFDDAFNYKEEIDLNSALKRYFPDGIDIYFDNVEGDMLEAAVSNMKINGWIAVCGVISEYFSNAEKRAAPSMIDVIYKRIKIQGFLSSDYWNMFGDFLSTTCDHLRAGAIRPLEDVSDGVESIPSALIDLFKGRNIGKKVVKIADE